MKELSFKLKENKWHFSMDGKDMMTNRHLLRLFQIALELIKSKEIESLNKSQDI